MQSDSITEMRPPIAIDANHVARLSALSSLTSGPMRKCANIFVRSSIARISFRRKNCDLTSSIWAARSNFVTNKPERYRKSSWFIRLMLTLRVGACLF